MSVEGLRARYELYLRELGGESEDLRFPFGQGDSAAGNVPRADDEIARRRAHGSADGLQVVAHGPEFQGVSYEAAGRQDWLRVREERAEARCKDSGQTWCGGFSAGSGRRGRWRRGGRG